MHFITVYFVLWEYKGRPLVVVWENPNLAKLLITVSVTSENKLFFYFFFFELWFKSLYSFMLAA